MPGGGARGIFQAEFLARLETDAAKPLSDVFDLVAATSTGAVVGLPIAAGIAASTVATLFRELVADVFVPPGPLAGLRRHAMYDPLPLRNCLERQLATRTMPELHTEVLIPVSVADRYQVRVLNRSSPGTIVEAAMATSAAPTYFPPHKYIGSDDRAYLDGGLWANDPTHLAVLYAIHTLGHLPENIDVLVLGNGNHVAGKHTDELERMRQISVSAFRILSEGTMTLQRSHAQASVSQMGLHPLVVDPGLSEPIRLDDAHEALRVLSPLVDIEYEAVREQVMQTFVLEGTEHTVPDRLPAATEAGARAANLTTFIPNRSFYKVARGDDDDISNYISRAQHDLTMISINLMTGHTFEQLLQTFRRMIVDRTPSVEIRLSLLNPENPHLMGAIAPVLDMSAAALQASIEELISKSLEFRNSLPRQKQPLFRLHVHDAIPPASAIMIDTRLDGGSIQLETKTYRTSPYHSFGFEVSSPSTFYDTLNESYERLIEDGHEVREDSGRN